MKDSVYKFVCEKENCEKKFQTVSKFKEHMNSHLNIRPFICDICDSAFYSKTNLDAHINNVHKKKGTKYCERCKKNFSTIYRFRDHSCAIKSELICEECGKEFRKLLSKKNHVERIHEKVPKRPISQHCHICDLRYPNNKSYLSHVKYEHNYNKRICKRCNMLFLTKIKLIEHQKDCNKEDNTNN